MDIKSAIQFIVSIENLRSKQDLDTWCGDMGKKKLYLYVQRLAPEHWEKISTPKINSPFSWLIASGRKMVNLPTTSSPSPSHWIVDTSCC